MHEFDYSQIKSLAREVIRKTSDAEKRVSKKLDKNVLDPFSAVFEAGIAGQTFDEWIEAEASRQVQKTLANAVGAFHQKLLGTVPEVVDTKSGGSVDLRSEKLRFIAEVKNKFNTMNSSSAEAVYQKLENHLRYTDKGFTAYLVAIVPKSSTRYDRPWTHSAKLVKPREDIREIDGASFYTLLTGDDQALRKVHAMLIRAIGELTDDFDGKLMSEGKFKVLFERAYGE